MSALKQNQRYSNSESSFLPEDYVEQRAERRTNIISLTLFAVVMAAVVAAFLVTNRQWNSVKSQQQAINVAYTSAAKEIEQLDLLQLQQETMMHKAELTAALIERVPRSVLLAELINRMPDEVSLLEFNLEVVEPKHARRSSKKSSVEDLGSRRKTKGDASEDQEEQRIEVPRYDTNLELVGVAPTDVEVSQYISALNGCELLHSVTLKYSENSMVDERLVREFRIHMELNPNADARQIDPMLVERSFDSHRAADTLKFGELPQALLDLEKKLGLAGADTGQEGD
ncbi:MAG: hypothetical protein KAS72_14915 [Phycisphaerales bacterium]|nr:hypothetical protein [Phycisphaerales bacterium]